MYIMLKYIFWDFSNIYITKKYNISVNTPSLITTFKLVVVLEKVDYGLFHVLISITIQCVVPCSMYVNCV